MKVQRFNNSLDASASAEQPNFDDERTIQSARRVVPLERIDAKLKHRRRWFLGGAFAVAMLLGAASAVISAYFRMRDVPSSEVAQLDVPAAAAPVVEEAAATFPADTEVVPEESVKPVTPKRTIIATRPRLVNRTSEPLDVPRLSEEDELRRIRETVLIDEWQERRQRRVMRRERRRADRFNHRDLSNLDEIFEGRKRP